MADGLLLLLAQVICTCAMAWFALSLKAHWRQVQGLDATLGGRRVVLLRLLGSAGLGAALWLCLLADAPSMAVLVWIMSLALAAFAVAFALSWRPGLLKPLAFCRRSLRSPL